MKRLFPLRGYRPQTLQVSLPAGYTLALAAVCVVVYVALIEALLRVPAVQSVLPVPSIGASSLYFEVALDKLDEFASQGSVDCIFLGSSLVHRGIDPTLFQEAYADQAGSEAMRCFNFGIHGMTASAAGIAAEYLVDTYHPRLLVYAFSPRAFGQGALDRSFTSEAISDLAWTQYVQGNFNLEGWLYAHSELYRYQWLALDWIGLGSTQIQRRREWKNALSKDNGFGARTEVITFPLAAAEVERVTLLFADYRVAPEEVRALERFTRLDTETATTVLLVEMPVHPNVISEVMGEDDYRSYNAMIRAHAGNLPYWATTSLGLIPDQGFADSNHLNATGAAIFSRWLGERVGEAVQQRALLSPGG